MTTLDELIEKHKSGGEDLTIEIFEHPDCQTHYKKLSSCYKKKYPRHEYREIQSVVYQAFLDALRVYDKDKGSTFQSMWSIRMMPSWAEFNKDKQLNGIFPTPQAYRNFKKVKTCLEEDPMMSDEEILEKTKIKSIKTVNNMKRISNNINLNCDEEGNEISVPVEVSFNHDNDIFDKYDKLYEALQELPERQMYILMQRFGLFDSKKMTLAEIAELSGCTSENIRLRQNKALKELKKIMKRNL